MLVAIFADDIDGDFVVMQLQQHVETEGMVVHRYSRCQVLGV